MKLRIRFLIIIGRLILILGITWYSFSTRNQKPAQIFPATIHSACAPWDGPAFTMFISMNDGEIMQIFIWQARDTPVPVTFSFPDDKGQIGFAYVHNN